LVSIVRDPHALQITGLPTWGMGKFRGNGMACRINITLASAIAAVVT
jgi:hypothetical protein